MAEIQSPSGGRAEPGRKKKDVRGRCRQEPRPGAGARGGGDREGAAHDGEQRVGNGGARGGARAGAGAHRQRAARRRRAGERRAGGERAAVAVSWPGMKSGRVQGVGLGWVPKYPDIFAESQQEQALGKGLVFFKRSTIWFNCTEKIQNVFAESSVRQKVFAESGAQQTAVLPRATWTGLSAKFACWQLLQILIFFKKFALFEKLHYEIIYKKVFAESHSRQSTMF